MAQGNEIAAANVVIKNFFMALERFSFRVCTKDYFSQ
jgi:hypothetical protein